MTSPAHLPKPPLSSATPAFGVDTLRLTQHGIGILVPSVVRFPPAKGACQPRPLGLGRRDPQPRRTFLNSANAQARGPSFDAALKYP
jgi:hypothetical protein